MLAAATPTIATRSCACPMRLGRPLLLPRLQSAVSRPRAAVSRGSPGRLRVQSAADTQMATAAPATEWFQKVVELPAYKRGCHVVTRPLLQQLPELVEFEVGMANLFIQHTSASLTINENASPDVPLDLADSLDDLVPEGDKKRYRHDDEGADDMPAHVKSSLMGASLTLPVQHGRFALGTWQGIYLNEHRNYGGPRRIVITIQGRKRADGRRYGSHK